MSFEQAYVQVYPPSNGGAESTLGFHFDDRSDYGELIVGVTLSGTGQFLLGSTNGGEFVDNVAKETGRPNVLTVPLTPRSVYAMTGLARYDLRHAVVNDGECVRVSVTFRSSPKARGVRGGSSVGVLPPQLPHLLRQAQPAAPSPTSTSVTAPMAKLAGSGSLSGGQCGRSPFVQQETLWFQGTQAINMREAIAEGTHAAHFETPVIDMLHLSCGSGGGGEGGGEGDGEDGCEDDSESKGPIPLDVLSDEGGKAAAELKNEIKRRARAPCGHTRCRFDGSCYRRDVAHWLQYGHPCELDKDYCPSLAIGQPCHNKGPEFASHNALFSHGPLPSAIEAAIASGAPTHSSSAAAASAAASSSYTSSYTFSASAACSSNGAFLSKNPCSNGYRAQLRSMSIRELKAESTLRGIDVLSCLERSDIIEHLSSCGSATPTAASTLQQQPSASQPPPLGAPWCKAPLPSLPERSGTKLKPLAKRFIVNPFSTLDAKQGAWQDRKREWHALFDSSLGRGADLLGAGLARMLPESSKLNGTSVFDPVLMESLCDWYVPRPRHHNVRHRPVVVIDPFAGGVVRGWVAAAKGLLYIGIDVSHTQIEANEAQIGPPGKFAFAHRPCWIVGDGENIGELVTAELRRRGFEPQADALISCPPYYNRAHPCECPHASAPILRQPALLRRARVTNSPSPLLSAERICSPSPQWRSTRPGQTT